MVMHLNPTLEKWPTVQTSLRNVLWAELNKDAFEVSLLAKKRPKAPLSLVHVTGTVDDADKESATVFTEAVISAAYAGNDIHVISVVMHIS